MWPATSHVLPISPRHHHAWGNHESDRGDAAIGGAAHDDQKNAGALFRDGMGVRHELLRFVLISILCFFITFVYFVNFQNYIENLKILFLKYYCMSSAENSDPIVCPRDLEGLLHRPHWITRGHRGAQMDCLHIPQGRHHVRTGLLLCMQRCGQMNMIATEPGLFLCRLRALEIQFLCLSRFHKFCSN